MYTYHYRPGYGSQQLLIEIYSGTEKEDFMTDLFIALAELHPEIIRQTEVWINDEILLEIKTDLGEVTLSRDIWDLVFILAENNQPCLSKINELLAAHEKFTKVEVDFKNYVLKT
jgi:hypothetical protein